MAGFYYSAVSPAPGLFEWSVIDGGLLTLSRFPIVEKEFEPFKCALLSDSLSKKGILYTKIQVSGDHHVKIFNTHTQATY